MWVFGDGFDGRVVRYCWSSDPSFPQFFINVVHNEFLDWFSHESDSAHPVFGMVTSGMDVTVRISKV